MKKIIFLTFFLSSHLFGQISYNMNLLSHLDPHPSVLGYSIGCWGYVQNGREYAIIGCQTGTSFIDITDSANIHEVAFLAGMSSNWRDFKTYGSYIYIVADNGGRMQIADLQYLPDSVHYITTYSYSIMTRAHTIQQSGHYLFVNGGNYSVGGVVVVDIANPEAPVKRGQWETQYVHDERIWNDTLWACNIYTGTVTLIDARDKDSLRTISNFTNGAGPMPHNCAFTTDHRYVLVTDEILNPVGRLKIWNIENLNSIQYVATWYPSGCDSANVHNIEVYGNYAVISHYTAGLRVLDITNPAIPVEAAYYDTYPANNGNTWDGCKGNYMLPSNKIIVNDKQTGFYCMKTTFTIIGVNNNQQVPAAFELKQNYPNPFNPSTTIEFSIPKNQFVTLKVFDITGKEVTTLLNGLVRGGRNTINYNASSLSSGVYFYRLTTENFSETKKMILVK